MERYIRNHTAISKEEQKLLSESKVLVVGCGGLGGYIIEALGRLGVGNISVLDSDVFEPSNLNRQLLSKDSTLGKAKAEVAKQRMEDVNPNVNIIPYVTRLAEENAIEYLKGNDLVIDALDNLSTRLTLIKVARSLNIPLVHGAIAGWRGRVSVIYPGDTAFEEILSLANKSLTQTDGNLGFTAACIASIQAAEATKILINRGRIKRNKILEINLLNGTFEEIDLA